VRTAVLAVLADQDAHGYQIIQEIGARTDGAWTPSPGSVYPLLQQLEDEGLVVAREADGKRVFSITDAGRTEAAERAEAAGRSPFDLDDTGGDLRQEAFLLMAAARQVGTAGTEAQRKQAEAVLADARKALYRLLAES
jgi:DNA-binding PadR family transcriptional regulator